MKEGSKSREQHGEMDGKTDMMNPRRPRGVKALCCWHCSYVDWCLQAPSLSIHTQKHTQERKRQQWEQIKKPVNIHNDATVDTAEHLQHLQIHSHVCTGNSICITTETSAVIHINDKSVLLVLFFQVGRGVKLSDAFVFWDFKPKHDFFPDIFSLFVNKENQKMIPEWLQK